MRRLILGVLCLSALGCGSGSSNSYDTSTVVAACDSASTALCNRASTCGKLASLGFASVSACVAYAENLAGCSTLVCPSGTTYSSSLASTCLTDIQNGACGSGKPAACSDLCQ